MTIRFLSDWDYYPNAGIDILTKNESFVRMAALYKNMGVANHAWPLALYDQDLSGVDPFDPNLSEEMQVKVITETSCNLWYHLREIARIPQDGSTTPSVYMANRGNMALSWAFICNIDIVLIMPRQCGKSVSTDTLMLWIMDISGRNNNIHLLTKDIQLRVKNIKRLKSQRSTLPWYLQTLTSKDADNTEILTNVTLKNAYLTAVGRKDKEAADNTGRGLTGSILHGDEPPYTPNIHISLPVALAAGTTARTLAKENNTFYCNIFTTTAGKRDTKEGAFCYKLFMDGAWWNEKYLDAPDRKGLLTMMRANMDGERILFNGTFSHLQLGKSNAWLKDAMLNATGTKESNERDFLNVWSSGGMDSPLDYDVLQRLKATEVEPLHIDVTANQYMLRYYVPSSQRNQYLSNNHTLLTLDSSNAAGRDANGITILDAKTMAVVMATDITEANNGEVAHWIADLLITNPKMTFVFENKMSGMTICDVVVSRLIVAGINPFTRIFNRLVQNIEDPKYRQDRKHLLDPNRADMSVYIKYKSLFGFMTTGALREYLYNQIISRATRDTAHLVRDKKLSEQLRSLVTIRGRIDHPADGHDDLAVSWLIGHWFATNGTNLGEYGIPTGSMYSHVVRNGAIETTSDEDMQKQKLFTAIKSRISELKEKAETTNNIFERNAVNRQIALLLSRIADVEVKASILSEVTDEVKVHGNNRLSQRKALERLAA